MAVSQDYVTWTCGPRIDKWYLYYVFQSRKAEFARIAFGNTIKTIGLDYFKHLTIPLPQILEQQEIARVIYSYDDLISSLERLIAKKQAIKQGIMQQLLTGHARLPGFAGTWRATSIGNILEFKNGLNKAAQYFGSGTPIINFMDVMNGPIITAGDVDGRVTLTREEIKRFSAQPGDMFFTRTSETVDEVGTAAVLVDAVPDAAFSGFILRGRPRSNESDSRFLAYLCQIDAIRNQITAIATYTTRALTNGRSLGRVAIEVPSLYEQQAIANVISDSDAEIAALRARLGKARDVRAGMMQQLITGCIGLPVPENAA